MEKQELEGGLEVLEADLAETENSVYHLVRSNVELAQVCQPCHVPLQKVRHTFDHKARRTVFGKVYLSTYTPDARPVKARTQ